MMRIALLGYYGRGNAGDDRILQCVQKIFCGHSFVVAEAWGDAEGRIDEINACDFVLLGGGGLIVPNLNRKAAFIKSIKSRFGCIGLGVEYRDKSNDDLIKILEDKAEFIWVRDQGGAALINCQTIMGGDLTFIDPYPVVFVQRNVCGVNPPWDWSPQQIGQCRRVLVESFAERVHLPFFDFGNPWPVIFRPADYLRNRYAKCRFVVGKRFHSVVFAIQSGLPFITFPYSPKSQRLCVDAGLSPYALSNVDGLEEQIDVMKRDYDRVRQQILEFRTMSVTAAVSAALHIKNIMGAE
jgi:hypothetical protein